MNKNQVDGYIGFPFAIKLQYNTRIASIKK